MSLSLNCFVFGDEPDRTFTVEIQETENVSILKKLIKKEKCSRLSNIDASDLDLFHVSFPIDNLAMKMENLKFAHLPKMSPPSRTLGTFFKDVVDNCLHVIAKAPAIQPTTPLDSSQPLSLNCLVFGDEPRRTFTVKVLKNKNVSILKDLIKEEKRSRLRDIDAPQLDLFHVSIPIGDDSEKSLKGFNLEQAKLLHPLLPLSQAFPRVERSHLHIIIRTPSADINEGQDTLTELRTQYYDSRTARAPSDGANSKKFASDQKKSKTRIECGRPCPEDLPIPLALQFASFGEFRDMIRCGQPNSAMSSVSLAMAHELTAIFTEEDHRRFHLLTLLEDVMGEPLERTSIDGTTYETDGGTANPLGEFKPPTASHVEVKKEKSEGSCEASFEVLLYYVEGVRSILTLTDSKALAWKRTRLPSILIVHAGPNLQVFATTWGRERPYMEVLSPDMPMFFHMRDVDARHDLAVLLTAIQNLHKAVSDVYRNPHDHIVSVDQIDFPYPRTYENLILNCQVPFRYVERVDMMRLVFRAVTEDNCQTDIFVKYMRRRYGKAAHEAAARLGVAPVLLGCQALPGDWWMVVLKPLPEGYVDFEDAKSPKNAIAKINEVVAAFHKEGFVHGDLRASNVFVKLDGGDWDVQLIDFDWAGQKGEVKYPMNVGCFEEIWRPRLSMDGEVITVEDDIAMVNNFSYPYHELLTWD